MHKKMIATLVLTGLIVAATPGSIRSVHAQDAVERETLVMGTGRVAGLYYPAGGALARTVNASDAGQRLRMVIESTGGSQENLTRLEEGGLDLGIADSAQHYRVWNGHAEAEETAGSVRSLMALHAEPLTVIVRADAGIDAVADLWDHPVNLGPDGDATRELFETVLTAFGWTEDKVEVHEVPPAGQVAGLCDGTYDAIAFVAPHPSGTINAALSSCDTRILPVTGPEIEALTAESPYMAQTIIPGGLYPGVTADVPTVGPTATLLTTDALDPEVAYAIVKAAVENLDALKGQHPVLGMITAQSMARAGLTAPLHDGAMRYYLEAGII
ncbi:MAG: TAXI family TRAP transporter solute-binding subunit [Inquilinaceae bacterium]